MNLAAKLQSIRIWEVQNIPRCAPQISLDLLLYCVAQFEASKAANVKSINLSLKYSRDRTRQVMQDLITNGYIYKKTNCNDTRVVEIYPTKKTLDLIKAYHEQIKSAL